MFFDLCIFKLFFFYFLIRNFKCILTYMFRYRLNDTIRPSGIDKLRIPTVYTITAFTMRCLLQKLHDNLVSGIRSQVLRQIHLVTHLNSVLQATLYVNINNIYVTVIVIVHKYVVLASHKTQQSRREWGKTHTDGYKSRKWLNSWPFCKSLLLYAVVSFVSVIKLHLFVIRVKEIPTDEVRMKKCSTPTSRWCTW